MYMHSFSGFGTPQGAWIWYDGFTLYGGMYAEIYLGNRLAYNQCRPCGVTDRLMLNNQAVNCIDHIINTSSLVLSSLDPDRLFAVSPCTASIYGITGISASFNGIWVLNSDGSGNVTLISQVLSGSDMPANLWGYANDTTYGNGQIAALRWPASTPIICGQAFISAMTYTSPVTISLSQPLPGVFVGDIFHIDGCTGSANLNGNSYSVIPLNGTYTQFVLSGSVSGSTQYTSSGYAFQQPPSSWKFNSTKPNHTFVWGYNNNNTVRWQGEYQRLQDQWALLNSENYGGCPDTPVVTPCSLPATDFRTAANIADFPTGINSSKSVFSLGYGVGSNRINLII